jgi:prepilin-type N-terminal cleavage/methylation domain-containing protein
MDAAPHPCGHGTARRRRGTPGFSLVELSVAIAVMAILAAIAIPAYLGARSNANGAAARTALQRALAAATSIATDAPTGSGWSSVTATALGAAEPALVVVSGSADLAGTAASRTVGVALSGDLAAPGTTGNTIESGRGPQDHDGALNLVARDTGGTCFVMRVLVGGRAIERRMTATPCTAATAASATPDQLLAWANW